MFVKFEPLPIKDVALTFPPTVSVCEGVVLKIPTRFVPVSILIAVSTPVIGFTLISKSCSLTVFSIMPALSTLSFMLLLLPIAIPTSLLNVTLPFYV